MLELKHITKTFDTDAGRVKAVDDVSLTINPGEIFGIIGFSGAGKSTLVRCINLLERPTSGNVVIDGTDLTTLSDADLRVVRRRIGMIFQHFNLMPSRTVFDNIALALRHSELGKERPRKLKSFWLWSGFRTSQTPIPRSFPAAKNSAWQLHEPLPTTRKCFCATKPRAHWIRKPRTRF